MSEQFTISGNGITVTAGTADGARQLWHMIQSDSHGIQPDKNPEEWTFDTRDKQEKFFLRVAAIMPNSVDRSRILDMSAMIMQGRCPLCPGRRNI